MGDELEALATELRGAPGTPARVMATDLEYGNAALRRLVRQALRAARSGAGPPRTARL